jgi:hypothetical protein
MENTLNYNYIDPIIECPDINPYLQAEFLLHFKPIINAIYQKGFKDGYNKGASDEREENTEKE